LTIHYSPLVRAQIPQPVVADTKVVGQFMFDGVLNPPDYFLWSAANLLDAETVDGDFVGQDHVVVA
jgi:hypothetical protein